ncbi:ComEC/Rec2 family competence protein [Nocardia wallacei]|uniref:ComEC/Rec2 family competence protein n=1 Tax=Nocardia wallacei TaxID=480035 RepID=UPI002457B74B|nr:ComEC/Rec2 family competence protein [Nocardia wallacei]
MGEAVDGEDSGGRAPVVEPELLDTRLLPAAVVCWGATIVAVVAGWRVGVVVAVGLVLAGIGLGAWLIRGARGELCRMLAAVALAAVLAGAGFAAAAAWREGRVAAHPLRVAAPGTYVTVVVTPVDDPKPLPSKAFGGRQWLLQANLREYRHAQTVVRAGGSVLVLVPEAGWQTVLPGQRVEFRARLDRPWRRDLTVAVLRAQGPPTGVAAPPWWQRAAGEVRSRLAAAADRALSDDAAGLLPGLVVGDVSRLPGHVRENFVQTDLAHLTAVSGMNVSILLAAVLFSVRALTLDARAGMALAALVLVLFVILARPSPSVLRAAVMGAIGLLALATGRRKHALSALCAAVLGLLAYLPALAVDAGFALSVLATAALILLAPNWSQWLQRRGWPRFLAEACAVATAAFLVTTPIIAALTGHAGLLGILANVLVEPVIVPITILGTVGAVLALLWMPAAVLVLTLTAPLLWWLLFVAERGAAAGLSVTVPSGVPGALLVATAALLIIAALHRITRTTTPEPPGTDHR